MNNGEFLLEDAIDAIEEVLASGGEFNLCPKGTSMLPLIVQGRDSVVLKRNTLMAPEKHDIVFYRRTNGQFVLHRVMDIAEDGTYTMCGDNQISLEYGISPTQIIAYVASITRKGKKLKMESGWYVFYVFWWCKLPMRKLLFLPRRAKGKIVRITKKIFGKRT